MDKLPGSIGECLDGMRQGTLTPTELVEYCLARIQAFDRHVCAFVLVNHDEARREARRLTALAANNKFVGPLHGIPIAIKDIIDVANMPTKAGSPLRQNAPPCKQDAPVVDALRKAGAIIIGKTITTEWAHLDPPATQNPWNGNCTPGGSSSGSAVAVAMGMCMGAIGTQTGGSILRPASFCGVCGLKPTFSAAMMEGIAPVSFHFDHVGPLARTVADLEVMHRVMTNSEAPRIRSMLELPPTLSRLDEYFVDEADAAVQSTFEKALGKLVGVEWKTPKRLPASFAMVHKNHYMISAVDAAQVHAEAFRKTPGKFSPRIAELLRDGLRAKLPEYVESLRHQQRFRCEIVNLMKDNSLWVMCSTPTTAPGPETTGDARFNSPWSYCGLPSITIPCGMDKEKGLPLGMQIVAPHHGERELLVAARWCQEQLHPVDYDELPVR